MYVCVWGGGGGEGNAVQILKLYAVLESISEGRLLDKWYVILKSELKLMFTEPS